MKLSMFGIVKRTIEARERIENLIASAEIGHVFVTVGGTQQDEAMCAVVKPVVIAELKARRASLDRDLESYGVEVKGQAPIEGKCR